MSVAVLERPRKVKAKKRPETKARRFPADLLEKQGWAILRDRGMGVREIAAEAGVGVAKVAAALEEIDASGVSPYAASDITFPSSWFKYADRERTPRPPRVVVILPRGGQLTPTSECGHDGPLPKGSPFYCPVCDAHGMDGEHASLVRREGDDPSNDDAVEELRFRIARIGMCIVVAAARGDMDLKKRLEDFQANSLNQRLANLLAKRTAGLEPDRPAACEARLARTAEQAADAWAAKYEALERRVRRRRLVQPPRLRVAA